MRGRSVERILVCKNAFLALHGIKKSRLLRKVQNDRVNLIDRRGRHLNRQHRVHPYVRRTVCEHIASFAARESHYSRKKNVHKRYLDSNLNIAKMHSMFCAKHPGLKVSYNKYREIFNTKFNIAFGYPRSDICDKCEELQAQMNTAKTSHDERRLKRLETEHQLHVARGDSFYSQQRDVVDSSGADCAVLAMDYEKNLPLPLTGVGPEYYKRQLWLYNLCIKDMTTNRSVMFMYSEHFARKGPNETTSCLLNYFDSLSPTIRKVCLFCDNCAAQNKNRYLWTVLQSLVESGRFDSIVIHYPVPGHSRLPCDRDFGLIEKQRRKMDRVLLPSEWVSMVRSVARNNPFEVRYVAHALTDDLHNDNTPVVQVRDFKTALSTAIAATVKNSQAFRGVSFTRNGSVARLTMNGNCDTPVTLLKRGGKWRTICLAVQHAHFAYVGFLPIKTAKYRDVQYLLGRVTIPETSTFYQSLTHSETAEENE